MKFTSLFFNFAVVSIEGGDYERLITRLLSTGISPGNIVPRPTGAVLTMPARHYRQVRTLRKGTGCSVCVMSKSGPYFATKRFVHRPSLLLSLILFIVAVQFLSGVIFRIDVSSLSPQEAEYVKAFLHTEGIYPGAYASSERLKQAEQNFLLVSDRYSYIKFNFFDGRIFVTSSPYIPPESLGSNSDALVADFSGIIYEMNVYDGNSLVTVNQSVTEGQTLVSSIRFTYKNEIVLSDVFADIVGYGEVTYEYVQPFSYTETLPTGVQKSRTALEFLGLRVPLYLDAEYDNGYRRQTHIKPLSILGFKLPLSVETTTLFETAKHDVHLNREQALQNAELAIHQKFLSDFNEPQVLVRLVSSQDTENGIHVTVSYEFLADIVKNSQKR